jgi:hypothetical protein
MLLSDRLYIFDKPIIALSGGHFEYFLSFPKKITLVYGLAAQAGADAIIITSTYDQTFNTAAKAAGKAIRWKR